jgi:ATP-dependent Clp protease ATP-binding subunit ClpC
MNWFTTFWNKLKQAANESANAAAFDDTFLNFTPRSQAVVGLAQQQARHCNHHFIGTEHLLLGLIEIGQGVAFNVLKRSGLDFEAVRQEIRKQASVPSETEPVHHTPQTPRLEKVFRIARKEADALHHTYVGTEHLLLGLIREHDGVAARVLRQFNVDLNRTRQEILRELDPNFLADDAPPVEPPQE